MLFQALGSGFIRRKMKQEALELDKEVLTTQDIIIDVWKAAIAQTSEFVQAMDDGECVGCWNFGC